MPDVTIHRCRVRVLRRDGWSWGPTPRDLVEQIVRWLPQVLAGRFAELAAEGEDVEVTAPVRVTIPIRLDQFAQTPAVPINAEPAMVKPKESQTVAVGVRSLAYLPAEARVEQRPGRATAFSADDVAVPIAVGESTALAHLLHAWHARGCLGILLRRLPPHTLADWHDALIPRRRHAETPVAPGEDSRIDSLVRVAMAKLGPVPSDRAMRVLCRLVVAAEAASALRRELESVEVWSAIERTLPADPSPAKESVQAGHDPEPMDVLTDPTRSTGLSEMTPRDETLAQPTPRQPIARMASATPPTIRSPSPHAWDVHVKSALPFLMLGPLAQVGFFDVVAATLEVEELDDAWPTFAAALAYKALDLPDSYGRRDPQAQRDSAAFAGSPEPIAETTLTDLAERTRGKLSALEAVIAHALLSGHTAGRPLLAHAFDGRDGWLLADTAGAFPIACTTRATDLLDWYPLVDGELLLLPRAAADPALVRTLNDANVRFVTDAPPLASDSWRSLRDGKDRWWTNDAMTSRAELLRSAKLLHDADETVRSVWQSLGGDRPTAPRVPGADLDRVLTLAASLALGQLAWILWGDREPTDPLLMIQRFANLDARVAFRAEEVRVTLPMGRRSWDLAEHRLTDDVRQLPWLGGRTVTFSMG